MAALPTKSSGKLRPWRWWRLQFGLRSLFALTLVASLLLGSWRWYGWTYERQYAAQQRLAPHATLIEMEAGSPAWLRPLYKKEIFRDVVLVKFDGNNRTDAELAPLAHFPRLRELTLDRSYITDAGLAHIARLTELEKLSLRDTNVTSAGLANLRGLKNLKTLDLSYTQVDGSGLTHLVGLNELESLDLENLNIEDNHLASLAELVDLKALNLKNTQIRGHGLKTLAQSPKLTTLQVSGERLEAVDVYDFVSLETLSVSVPERRLARCRVYDCPRLASLWIESRFDSLDLQDLPRLVRFANTDPIATVRRLRAAGAAPGEKIPELRLVTVRVWDLPGLQSLMLFSDGRLSLDVQHATALKTMELDTPGIQQASFKDVPLLMYLHLTLMPSSDQVTLPFEQLGSVRRLDLACNKSSKLPLSSLRKLQNLEELRLQFSSIDDADLASIGKLAKLRKLSLDSTTLRDEGLVHLQHLRGLQTIELLSPKLSVEAVRGLSQALPADCVLNRSYHYYGACALGLSKDDVYRGGQRVVKVR